MDHSFDDSDVPEDVRQAFERDIETFEQTQPVAPFEQLEASGLELPAPETLNDEELTEALWRVVRGLAFLGVFLHHTDHLSDRELYESLWHDVLRQSVVMMPGNPNFGFHLDLVESGDAQNERLYLRYYADEETRQRWAEEASEQEIPPSETPPFDRDRLLPQQSATRALSDQAS